MQCFYCDKLTGNYETDKETCANCREVLKIDLVRAVLEMDPVYLSESNRNKKGRKPKLSATDQYDITQAYKNHTESMGKLAKMYNVSKSTIYNIAHNGKY